MTPRLKKTQLLKLKISNCSVTEEVAAEDEETDKV